MSACTFFGHRDAPQCIQTVLCTVLLDLIKSQQVTDFYVGNHGVFDRLVYTTLQELKQQFPHICVTVVLAYIPIVSTGCYWKESIVPEGIEMVPKRFAIDYRNKWMLRQSQYVVTYITHNWGGAAKFADTARRQQKAVINIAKILANPP